MGLTSQCREPVKMHLARTDEPHPGHTLVRYARTEDLLEVRIPESSLSQIVIEGMFGEGITESCCEALFRCRTWLREDGIMIIRGSGAFGNVDYGLLEALWACGFLFCRVDESQFGPEWNPADAFVVVPYAKGLAEDVMRERLDAYKEDVLRWRFLYKERVIPLRQLPESSARRVAIFGAGATGEKVFQAIRASDRDVTCFLDNRPPDGGQLMERPVIRPECARTHETQEDAVVLASASYQARREMFKQLSRSGYSLPVFAV